MIYPHIGRPSLSPIAHLWRLQPRRKLDVGRPLIAPPGEAVARHGCSPPPARAGTPGRRRARCSTVREYRSLNRSPDSKAGVPLKALPSLNTSPRWPPQSAHRSSEPRAKEVKLVSVSTRKRRRERGPARAQLPVPLSNLTKLSKRGALHPAQTKVPLRFSLSSGEERAVVPFRRVAQDKVLAGRQNCLPLVLLRVARHTVLCKRCGSATRTHSRVCRVHVHTQHSGGVRNTDGGPDLSSYSRADRWPARARPPRGCSPESGTTPMRRRR